MATPRYISGTNAFIPEATGQAIAFVRDPAKFKINQYVQIIKAPKPIFLWAFLDPDEAIRVVTDQEFDWPDGQPAPRPAGNIGNFKWEEGRCFRRAYGYAVGEQALETAEGWGNPRAFFNAIILSKAMTNKTNRVIGMLQTTGNWGTGHFGTANSLNGGIGTTTGASDDETSAKYLAIKKTIDGARLKILLKTNGMVSDNELIMILSPQAAVNWSQTAEVHNYIKQSPFALAQLRGDVENQNGTFGLPTHLYGMKIVVETAPIVNIRANADGTPATVGTEKVFIKNDSTAIIVARPGSLDGNYGAPSFSTAQCYYYKYEMAIEAEHKAWDKLHEARVVDQFKEILAAPHAGFLITSLFD